MNSVEKYIDFDQFPKTKAGRISWKNCVGLTFDFVYNGEPHSFKIESTDGDSCSGILDNTIAVDKISYTAIKNLMFYRYFCKMEPFYKINEVVNENILIIDYWTKELDRKHHKHYVEKYYKCKCLIDGYEWITTERSLKSGHGCHVCTNNATISGYNDIETMRPDIVRYFVHKTDTNKYSPYSNKSVEMKCPVCGHVKIEKIARVTTEGFHCPMCSDNISYPNKFARNLFNTLYDQYDEYVYEYRPKWAGKYRYDNYFVLKDGTELIVEMDGGQHYSDDSYFNTDSDAIKEELAKENCVNIIRVNCNYSYHSGKFDYIRNNIIESLSSYFNFDNIDWNSLFEKCNENEFILTINEYNKNRNITVKELSKIINISKGSVLHYLHKGHVLGLCVYEKGSRTSKPIFAIDKYENKLAFRSIGDFCKSIGLEQNNKNIGKIRYCIKTGKCFNDYILNYTTYEEYYDFVYSRQVS